MVRLGDKVYNLESVADLEALVAASQDKRQIIFKHSTRCSISSMVLNRFARGVDALLEKGQVHILDLIAYREVSNTISTTFGVPHESPQVLVIEKGECIYHNSHMGIDVATLSGL